MGIPSDVASGHCSAGPFLSNQSTYNHKVGRSQAFALQDPESSLLSMATQMSQVIGAL